LPWIRHAEPWALDALDFSERTALQPSDRRWINALLFGLPVKRDSAIYSGFVMPAELLIVHTMIWFLHSVHV
jgi:hypothetical protein